MTSKFIRASVKINRYNNLPKLLKKNIFKPEYCGEFLDKLWISKRIIPGDERDDTPAVQLPESHVYISELY